MITVYIAVCKHILRERNVVYLINRGQRALNVEQKLRQSRLSIPIGYLFNQYQ